MANVDKRLFGAFRKIDEEEAEEHYCVNDRDLNKCTSRQRAYIHGLLDKANISEDELFAYLMFSDHETLKDLTIEEAGEAIDYLKDELGYN